MPNSEQEPEQVTEHDAAKGVAWYNKRALLIAWLLVFVPIGLFGLWKTSVFEKNIKIGIAIGAVVLIFAGVFKASNPIHPFVLFPIAIYLLWKAPDVTRSLTMRFVIAWAVIIVLFLFNPQLGGKSYDYDYIGGSCAAAVTEGNCTYFRDDNCKVIGQQCN